ncbi:hypothetical protein PsalN5692_03034 [Piscirickettsia salmonis]|uniref:hypothetical protein n=1 Tax=Piscirickettsia salmonis TaxID=1238 RepID=UPI0012B88875|nr:hypothetical protein [Piscirickettsia salmonis]QGP51550.1 hypothetical protein PsalN5692_03034 [Piscirickettsia salmonis]
MKKTSLAVIALGLLSVASLTQAATMAKTVCNINITVPSNPSSQGATQYSDVDFNAIGSNGIVLGTISNLAPGKHKVLPIECSTSEVTGVKLFAEPHYKTNNNESLNASYGSYQYIGNGSESQPGEILLGSTGVSVTFTTRDTSGHPQFVEVSSEAANKKFNDIKF